MVTVYKLHRRSLTLHNIVNSKKFGLYNNSNKISDKIVTMGVVYVQAIISCATFYEYSFTSVRSRGIERN